VRLASAANPDAVNDLAIIVVSTNEADWLRPCLTTVFEHAGGADLDVVVANNSSTDETEEVVRDEFPQARTVLCENRGFAYANNRALMTTDARYVLLLNPDTEIVEGTFAELVSALDARPHVGVAGVRQLTLDDELYPTMRRFPSGIRALGEALGSERLPVKGSWLGERVLDLDLYDREFAADWTAGSFIVCRREALESAGYLDERFFMYAEETDWCLRIKEAGWEVHHLPVMTIRHHFQRSRYNPLREAQRAYSCRHYAAKNFSPVHAAFYLGAVGLRYSIRSLVPGRSNERQQRRKGSRIGVAALLGLRPPPYREQPDQAVALRDEALDPSAVDVES
jgi:N-acetylglucosaminyl-diphospho-decaprenol L-rhamnosyltransferase